MIAAAGTYRPIRSPQKAWFETIKNKGMGVTPRFVMMAIGIHSEHENVKSRSFPYLSESFPTHVT